MTQSRRESAHAALAFAVLAVAPQQLRGAILSQSGDEVRAAVLNAAADRLGDVPAAELLRLWAADPELWRSR
jgi:hypothetical protein